MKRLPNFLQWSLCLATLLFPALLQAQWGFQKVVRYLGQEDYLLQAELVDTYGVAGLGYVTDSNNIDLLVHADLQGNVVWNRAMVNGPNADFTLQDLCVEGAEIFMSGEADGDSAAAAIHKFDLNGTLAWTRVFSYHPDDVAITSLAGDQNGNVVFGGQVRDSIFSARGMVGKIRGSDGAPMWMSTIDDTVQFDIEVVASTPTGEVIAAGYVSNWPFLTVDHAWIAKWDANGTLLWCKELADSWYIESIEADANHIYVGGIESLNYHGFVGQFSHGGNIMRWRTLDDADHESWVEDLKVSGGQVRMVGFHYDMVSGLETGLLMRLDSNLAPVWAWRDQYGRPMAIAGTDHHNMLHYVGSYFGDSLNDESILIGAIPDAGGPTPPCYMMHYTPSFDNTIPTVLNYAVATDTTYRNGYAPWSTYSLPLSPLTECQSGLGVEPGPGVDIKVWPNPVSGMCRVSLPEGNCSLKCMDMTGQVVLQVSGSGQVDVDMKGLARGMYMLVVEDEVGGRWSRRVCKVE
jgi:hypothetical protein